MLLVWLGVPSVSLPLFRALAVLLAAVSFVAVIYTGLLLSGMPSVPLWFGPWLPGLFAISALSCGVALVSMVAVFSGMATVFGRTMRQVVRADMVLLALEAVVVALWLGAAWLEHGGSASSGATPTDAAALTSVASVLNGACSLPFWGGLVLVGLVAPFAIEAVLARCNASKDVAEASLASRALLASAGCVLVGGACLRAVVVAAGMLPVVSVPF